MFGCSSQAKPAEEAVKAAPAPTPVVANTSGLTPEQVATQADLPIYPGASFPDGVSKPPTKDSNGKLHVYLVMTTPDSADKVISFYKAKEQKMEVVPDSKVTQVMGETPKGNMAILKVSSDKKGTTIDISSIQN